MVKRLRTRLIIPIVSITFCVASVAVPFVSWYPPGLNLQVRGDLDLFGFDAYGWMSVENAIARRFSFFEYNFNVSIPVEDCRIDSLMIIKGKEKGSAFYDTVLLNATGKLNIQAINVSLFSYEVQHANSNGTLSFVSQNVESFVPSSDQTGLVFWFGSNISRTLNVFLPEGNEQELILDFGANDGSLEVIGDQNFTLPLTNDRAGVVLTVSVPRNRAYDAQIAGEIQSISMSNFGIVKYVFYRGIGNASSFKGFYPRGELAYGDKTRELLGGQDVNLTDFAGVVSLLPTSNPGLLRALVGGNTPSLIPGSPDRQEVLSLGTGWDVIFPSPFPFSWFGFGVMAATLVWLLNHPERIP